MDQAEPAHQTLLRPERQCRQNSDLDFHCRLRPDGNREEGAGTGAEFDEHFANREFERIFKRASESTAYKSRFPEN